MIFWEHCGHCHHSLCPLESPVLFCATLLWHQCLSTAAPQLSAEACPWALTNCAGARSVQESQLLWAGPRPRCRGLKHSFSSSSPEDKTLKGNHPWGGALWGQAEVLLQIWPKSLLLNFSPFSVLLALFPF